MMPMQSFPMGQFDLTVAFQLCQESSTVQQLPYAV